MDWNSKSPTNGVTKNVIGKCSFRILLLPVALLGAIGFLVNYTHITLPYSIQGTCVPKTNIVFLKTHKCAGSSIQNILMRYGDAHNLTFVLPDTGNYLGHPEPFSDEQLAKPKLKAYNILAHHTRFDYKSISKLMPKDTVFITIVRDPVQLFESSYTYYQLDKFFQMDLQKFAYLSPGFSSKFLLQRYLGKFGINQMMFDLGASVQQLTNHTAMVEYVDLLDSWFDFVLVADRMEESLVMLKELLCWTLDDVLTFKLNARNPVYKTNLTDLDRINLRQVNSPDQVLYERFITKFERQLEEYGKQRLSEESDILRRRTQEWYDMCVQDIQPLTTPQAKSNYYYNTRVMTFEPRYNNNNETCKAMIMEELSFTDRLRRKQQKPTKKPRYYSKRSRVLRRSKLR